MDEYFKKYENKIPTKRYDDYLRYNKSSNYDLISKPNKEKDSHIEDIMEILDKSDVPKELREQCRQIGIGRQMFWDMLMHIHERVITFNSYPVTIWSVACGSRYDYEVLIEFYGNREFGSVVFTTNTALLYGIDISEESVTECQTLYKKWNHNSEKSELPKYYNFLVGDATHLEKLDIPKPDVIFIGHQQISASKKIWGDIFMSCYEQMKKGSVMVITSYTHVEHSMMLEKLSELQIPVKKSDKNPFSKQLVDNIPDLCKNNYYVLIMK